jgi:hypothetical protein
MSMPGGARRAVGLAPGSVHGTLRNLWQAPIQSLNAPFKKTVVAVAERAATSRKSFLGCATVQKKRVTGIFKGEAPQPRGFGGRPKTSATATVI